MKIKSCIAWAIALAAIVIGNLSAQAATLSTGFSYQGRLFDGGTAANGQYEMEFILRDQATGGNQVGTTIAIAPVTVTNGLFQVTVDFGTNVWDGDARWLDVSVRTNGSTSPHTLLTPSQLIQPVPYAIHSIKAGELVGTLPSTQLSGQYPNPVTLNNAANAFGGNGSGLTSLNASQLATGTVPDARLDAAMTRDTELLSVSNALSGQLTSNNSSVLGAINTTSNGLSSRLEATNAALVGLMNNGDSNLFFALGQTNTALLAFLDATNMALMSKITASSNGLQTAIDNEAAARAAFTTMLQTGDNAFAGSNHFSGITLLTNTANVLAGDGAGLTALNGSQIASGIVADARIDAALARDTEVLSVSNSLNSQLSANNSALISTITTTSNGLDARLVATNAALIGFLDATNTALMSKITTSSNGLQTAIDNEAAARSALTTMLQTGDNAFAGSNHFSGITLLTNTANVLAGDGSGLTALNGSQISSGTVADARIDAALARDSEVLSVSNSLNSQISSQNSALISTITTTSNGLDARLVATNAALIGFLDATNTALMSKITTSSNGLQTAIDNEAAARSALTTMLQTGDNAFAGSNHFSGITLLTNAANILAGDGSGLTGLDGSQITSGTVADARIDAALARDSEVLSVSNSLNSLITAQNTSLLGAITTTSNGLDARLVATNSALIGFLEATNTALMSKITTSSNALQTAIDNEAAARAAIVTQFTNGNNNFAGTNHFSGVTVLTNVGNVLAGDGSGITSLNGTQINSGTVSEIRIDSALARDSEVLSVSNSLNSLITAQNSSLLGTITTTSNGLDSRLIATNAALIGFLDATNTALMSKISTTSNALDSAIATVDTALTALDTRLQTGNNTFAGSNHFSGIVVATNTANQMVGTFTGDGSALTGLAAGSLTGTVPSSALSGIYSQNLELSGANVYSGDNVFSMSNHFSGLLVATNTGNVLVGDGANLTALNGSAIASGTVDDARLSGNVALTTNGATFAGDLGGQRLNIGQGHTLVGNFATIAGGETNSVAANGGAVGGGWYNTIDSSSPYSSIGGGVSNRVQGAPLSFIGGGETNYSGDGEYNVIGGGLGNRLDLSFNSFIGGGRQNSAGGESSYVTIAGGRDNEADSSYTATGGGQNNTNSGTWGMIPGGRDNYVNGSYSLAAGRRAKATHAGAFVWADNTDADFTSAAAKTFNVRANGGVAFTTGGSGFAVDGNSVLTTTSTIGGSQLNGTYSQNLTLSGANVHSGSNHFSGVLVATNTANVFNGDGSGLSGLWRTGGNTGTTAGTDFLGTTDNEAFELHVNSARAFRVEPTSISTAPNVIGGSSTNHVASGVVGATISGGGSIEMGEGTEYNPNLIRDNADFATIGGGKDNVIATNSESATIAGGQSHNIENNAWFSTIAGGSGNTVRSGGTYAVIGGGLANRVETNVNYGTIGGGINNVIATNSDYSVISGGSLNGTGADASYATVAGGRQNSANAAYASVGGGQGNTVGSQYAGIASGQNNTINSGSDKSAIGGGINNIVSSSGAFVGAGLANVVDAATATWSFIGAGANNSITGTSDSAVIGGGQHNTNVGSYSFIGAGLSNRISATHAMIPGGFSNHVSGAFGFAAGNRATAAHTGSFVWADSEGAEFASSANNTFNVRSGGGVVLETSGAGATLDGSAILTSANGAQLSVNNAFGGDNTFNGTNVFQGSNHFGAIVVATNSANQFSGDGSGLTSVNADTLDNLDSTAFWQIGGNSGTTAGTHFIGTTDSQPVEFKVESERVMRFEGGAGTEPNILGGILNNDIDDGVKGAVIVGGGIFLDAMAEQSLEPNYIRSGADHSAIVGGYDNQILTNASESFIGGGHDHTIKDNSNRAVIAGGRSHTISTNSDYSVIAGGDFNRIFENITGGAILGGTSHEIYTNADYSVIAGGQNNLIGTNAQYAAIPGGQNNAATGSYSFAAGRRAKAIHDGAFVWADSTAADFSSTIANEFRVRARGGVVLDAGTKDIEFTTSGFITWNGSIIHGAQSDRNVKKNKQPVDTVEVVEKLAAIPVESWNYKRESDDEVPHMGPYAQDFKRAFYPGRDDKQITWLEFHGVELAAIQGLNKKLENKLKEKDEELSEMRRELDSLKELVKAMQKSGGAQ